MLIEPEHRGQMPVHRRRRPRARVPVSNTITLSAGARSHATNRATSSTPTSRPADLDRARNSNHNFKLVA